MCSVELLVEDTCSSAERLRPHSPAPAAEVVDLSGQVLSRRYELIRKLSTGGMGSVYLARHRVLGRCFAIKILGERYNREKQAVLRFVGEAKATSNLHHPNIVDVCDFGISRTNVYLVMEHLEGEDLAETLRRDGPMPWTRVARILMQVCSALQFAHSRRVIHRDIKPSNCFRVGAEGNDDMIKVLDFGIAKVLGEVGEGGLAVVTDTHIVAGTLEYMAPESLTGGVIDARVDVYAVGMLGYHLLTGRLPFHRSRGDLLKAVCAGVSTPPGQAAPSLGIPDYVDAIIMRALRPAAADRFSTISEFGAAIASSALSTPSLALGNTGDPAIGAPRIGAVARSPGHPTPRSAWPRSRILIPSAIALMVIGASVLTRATSRAGASSGGLADPPAVWSREYPGSEPEGMNEGARQEDPSPRLDGASDSDRSSLPIRVCTEGGHDQYRREIPGSCTAHSEVARGQGAVLKNLNRSSPVEDPGARCTDQDGEDW